MSVYYEWVVEWLDDYDDIVDVSHFHRLREAMDHAAWMVAHRANRRGETDVVIGLVYNRIDDFDQNLEDRQWAYLEGGVLPAKFDGGAKIPRRFFIETTNVVVTKK